MHTHVHIYTHTHIHTYEYIIQIHTYKYIHIHTCIHTHTHTQTHTYITPHKETLFVLLIFERQIYRRIYGPKYENREMEKSDESRTRRDEQRRKYNEMDKIAKDKLVRSPRENGGG